MPSVLGVGHILKGKLSVYTITKQLRQSIWLATSRNQETVVIKIVGHFRLKNESNVLNRFQNRAPLRPLIDEIEDPSNPPALVLEYRLTRPETRYVIRNVVEAVKSLHEDGFVHTDIKPDNVLINYGHADIRFSDVKLGDCGSTVHRDSGHAKDGHLIGAPIFRSPEAQLRLPWDTATDIWSIGAMAKIADEDTLAVLVYAMEGVTHGMMKPFQYISEWEISREDKAFILKIMKLISYTSIGFDIADALLVRFSS
ncbi:kinase-like protein [Pleomassaria siparia CBS 279.74]|uniref:Kinase-like protein n=1 Tax=Pleomassaria siparia CBS 279.74 TaxID=1314801 RepID=A0A6G1KK72_9PLEO|nr:kinase-like protein [Pleomassaria siparia CBS 279.74]